MGYRSQVYLKTTTEGYVIMKKMNDSIKEPENKIFRWAEIHSTETGFYKIHYDDIKWYDSYTQIQNFNKALCELGRQDIPYVFIRIGEETDDIEIHNNWTDDMPDELVEFEPLIDVYDPDATSYKVVKNPDSGL